MGSVPGADLTTALTAGVLAPLVHLACARIALGIGWQRGYMREGFLHGIILGPLGLLTTFALRKRSRPSEWIREEYQRLSRDPAGVLFFTAAALFSAALAVGYGLAAFRIAAQQPAPGWIWFFGLGLLVAGYLAFCYSSPPSDWIPALPEWDDYPEDPEYGAWIKYLNERQRFYHRARLQGLLATAGTWTALAALLAAITCFSLLFEGLVACLALGSVVAMTAGLAAAIILRQRATEASQAGDTYTGEHAEIDRGWHPAFPLETRREYARQKARELVLAKEYNCALRLSKLCVVCGVIGLLVGLLTLLMQEGWPQIWFGIYLLAASAVCFWLWRIHESRVGPLLDEFSREHENVTAWEPVLDGLIRKYETERGQVELAFRHEDFPESLLEREIQVHKEDEATPPVSPAQEQPAPGPHAGSSAGAAAPQAPAPAGPPLEELLRPQPPGRVSRQAYTHSRNPRYYRLKSLSGLCFRLSFFVFLAVTRLSSSSTPALPLLLLAVFVALILAGAFYSSKAAAEPESFDVPLLPEGVYEEGDPPAPPEGRGSTAEGIGSVAAASTAAEAGTAAAQPPRDRISLQSELELHKKHQRGNALLSAWLIYPPLLATAYSLVLLVAPLYSLYEASPVFYVALASAVILLPFGVSLWLSNAKLEERIINLIMDQQDTDLDRRIVHQNAFLKQHAVSARNRLRLLWLIGLTLAAVAMSSAARLGGLNPGEEPLPVTLALAIALGLAAAGAAVGYYYFRAVQGLRYWRGRLRSHLKEHMRERYRSASELRARTTVRDVHDGYHVQYTPGELDEATIERWVELDLQDFGKRERIEQLLDRAGSVAFTLFWLAAAGAVACGGSASLAGLRHGLYFGCGILLALGCACLAARLLRLKHLRALG